MISTDSIKALIRDNKTFQIVSEIQTGQKYGMNTLDAHLLQLYEEEKITYADMITKAKDVKAINNNQVSEFWSNSNISKLEEVLQNIGDELDSIMVSNFAQYYLTLIFSYLLGRRL